LVLLTQVAFPPQPHTGNCICFWSGRFRGCALCGLRSAELGQERLRGDGSRVEGRRVDNEKRAGTRRAFEEMERHAVGTWSVARAARSIAPPSPCTRRLVSGTTSSKGEAPLERGGQGVSYPCTREQFLPLRTQESGNYANGCESAHSANFTNR
jgi:hypothetical protein